MRHWNPAQFVLFMFPRIAHNYTGQRPSLAREVCTRFSCSANLPLLDVRRFLRVLRLGRAIAYLASLTATPGSMTDARDNHLKREINNFNVRKQIPPDFRTPASPHSRLSLCSVECASTVWIITVLGWGNGELVHIHDKPAHNVYALVYVPEHRVREGVVSSWHSWRRQTTSLRNTCVSPHDIA